MAKYSMRTKDRMITYKYRTRTAGFETNLLCEVGAPYQAWFKNEIARRGWTIETRELDTKPWLADFIVPGNPQPSR